MPKSNHLNDDQSTFLQHICDDTSDNIDLNETDLKLWLTDKNFIQEFYQIIFNLLYEKNSEDFEKVLMGMKKHFSSDELKFILTKLLKEACKCENHQFIKILVKNDCRLTLEENNKDKIDDLYVMKMMVNKEYIFNCFQAATDQMKTLEQQCHGECKETNNQGL